MLQVVSGVPFNGIFYVGPVDCFHFNLEQSVLFSLFISQSISILLNLLSLFFFFSLVRLSVSSNESKQDMT